MIMAFYRTQACAWRALGFHLFAAVVLLLIVGAGLGGPAAAQPANDQAAIHAKLEGQRAIVDSVEAALGRDNLSSSDLDGLRARIDPVRDELTAGVALLDPLLGELQKRIQEIGPKPADDAPPENPSITHERDLLTTRASELDGVLKQARLLKVRADQVADRITSRRRALFTDTLLLRTYSALDPQLWIAAAAALPGELRGISYLVSDWKAFANARMSIAGQMAVAFGVLCIVGFVFGLQRFTTRPIRRVEEGEAGEELTRLKACALSALIALVNMAAAPLALFAALALLDAFNLIPPRVAEVAQGLSLAVTVVAVGRGLLLGALAPGDDRRRVLPLSDQVAKLLYNSALTGLWVLAASALLNTLHRALVAPVALTVATTATMAAALVVIAARSIRKLNVDSPDDETPPPDAGETAPASPTSLLQWIRFPFWLMNAIILVALVAGYVNLGGFLASRSLIAVVTAGAFYLVIALINAFFIDGTASGPRARAVAKMLGVRVASLELLAVLLAGVLKAVAFMVMLILVVGTWGTSTADLKDFVNRITFGFSIGNSTITIGSVLSAMLFLAAGILVARALQRWVAVAILPRTNFDTGLQNSISTIIGYVASIAVIAMAMSQIGINLENIALVAGALSVGIGFGLQSIVSNFVSGLILLAERPIRVGDTISVKGEEGYVRRISVRATEIETFDRAAVVIPNSDLITGMVKNFTHANTTGRVIVPVNVAYDADADEVRDILIGCACDHPQVLRSPPPRVFLLAFGDSYLKFELRCVVANVDYGLTVKSDLHFAVLERLKAARIGIPYTPWAIYRGQSLDAETAKDDGGD
ncbi:DUF3772 domain-containing protein [Ancylobacter sp. A5.8]|uniref:DUF3772 domain-containing protein n=1 Tax=Ancylobacter gelatini TaxID=2919920 RepID=UPI001F4DFAA6|nr:DUF3772 domain-containing protein [Ancylobacter gelatini]MCJ8145168.1 DUF3772 domain-containing protein [Ancylobacter gelatini]